MTPATPDKAAADLYDALDADDTRRVDTRAAFISGYQAAWPRGLQAGRAEVYALRGHEAAALDGLASNGPAQAYTLGYEAGRVEAFAQQAATAVESATTELELLAAGGYTPEQEARADALAAASHVLAAAVQSGGLIVIQEGDGILGLGAALVKLAREPATWIEHGDQPKACTPIPCPPFEETFLAVDTASGLVDEARGVVRGVTGLGHRVDQALDAAKMAQPRARPTQT